MHGLLGGTDPRHKNSNGRNVVVNSVWMANLKTGEWHHEPDNPKDLDSPRSHFGHISNEGVIYIFGGNDENAK